MRKVCLVLMTMTTNVLGQIKGGWNLNPVKAPPECTFNSECAQDRYCTNGKCVDPCQGPCGPNAICRVENYNVACSCPPTFMGDPFQGCREKPKPTIPTLPTVPPGKKKFEVVTNEKFNWLKAYEYCRKNKRLLATVLSKEENDQVLELIKKLVAKEGHFWLAATDLAHEGSWIWFTTGQPIKYADWLSGEPNNHEGNEHCLEYFDKFENGEYQWNDVDCSKEYNFICEYYE